VDPVGPSRTAVLVCQGRAVADGRLAVGRFSDPVASRLLRPDELEVVARARSGDLPTAWRERLEVERVAACGELMAPRTVAIDDAVRRAANRQVVIVGAGLDGRPWRWEAHLAPVLYAVDHPATQSDVAARAAALEPTVGRLVPVPVDLAREPLDARLAAAGHDRGEPTTWIWEGVVPYLTETEVRTTLAAMSGRSAPGSVLVVNYQTSQLRARIGRVLVAVVSRITGAVNPMADEPWRSTWSPGSMAALLGGHGWAAGEDEDLATIAGRIGVAVAHGGISSGRVVAATRTGG
jgi:methyltransferase (TIGR00027 family)